MKELNQLSIAAIDNMTTDLKCMVIEKTQSIFIVEVYDYKTLSSSDKSRLEKLLGKSIIFAHDVGPNRRLFLRTGGDEFFDEKFNVMSEMLRTEFSFSFKIAFDRLVLK